MNTSEVTLTLLRLQNLTEQVIQDLIAADASRIESLVVEQCRLLNTLPRQGLQKSHLDRLNRVQERVKEQQVLVGQALGVTEQFLQVVNQGGTYSSLG